MVDQKIRNTGIIKPLPTGIPDMERCLHAREELDQVDELRITARVTAATDADPGDIIGHHLQLREGVICHGPEILKPAIVFLHASRAVITANGIGRAVSGIRTEWFPLRGENSSIHRNPGSPGPVSRRYPRSAAPSCVYRQSIRINPSFRAAPPRLIR